ncbi:hypothetical protein B0T18DRAFT_412272 [Schizothecium vesticola]|uniref:Uncharacterized protein n=1 Tax=Schizothecium vesticola TaxID=314040 RepID=A0AA40K5I3_9PEZI|nr:hypothetical protein B0T18DRAFT_412272 [Schizothecium vesticola]
MPPSTSPALLYTSHAISLTFLAFGLNALLNPSSALSFYLLAPPSASTPPSDAQAVHSLLAAYGVRDIFMGLSLFSAGLFGTSKSLGLTLLAAAAVAVADGFVCQVYAGGEGVMNHWGYAPLVAMLGVAVLR